MVNRGVSRGCVTCKKRRVKCDETKPSCKECVRLKRHCAGYGSPGIRVRFKDETARYLNRRTTNKASHTRVKTQNPDNSNKRTDVSRHLIGSRKHVAIPESPQCKQQDMAFAFFLKDVTKVGRSPESTRGFLEFICPVLATESYSSALYAAVNAAASKLWAVMRPSGTVASSPIRLHNQALIRLQQAINSPIEQKKQATVFAALMLQYHATMTAIFDHNKASNTHRNGALALLMHNCHYMEDLHYRGYLLGNYLHSKVSACIRHKISLTQGEYDWIRTEVIPLLPENANTSLDVVGMSLSRLQNVFTKCVHSGGKISVSSVWQELPALVFDLDAQLQAWAEAVPTLWRPKRMQKKDLLSLSVDTYDGSCDIYPSVQIANIWNLWRMYRLIVECIKVSLIDISMSTADSEERILPTDQTPFDSTGFQQLQAAQGLLDSLCRSIPFYLGNCQQPLSFADLDSSRIVFPSYHDLGCADEAFVSYKHSDHYVHQMDHYRHVVLHGPLHALSVLSSVRDLLSGELCSMSAQRCLYGQKQWIDEQFQRCLYLTRFTSRNSDVSGKTQQLKQSEHVRQALSTVTTL